MRYEKLILISADANSNKEYIMQEKPDGTFTVSFGRVGAVYQTASYSISQWNKKLNEKIKKGYKSVTDLVSVSSSQEAKLSGDIKIDALLTKLLSASRNAFSATYRVAASAVTTAQVNEVQRLIVLTNEEIKRASDLEKVKKLFVEIWHVLPRTMGNVRLYLPNSFERAAELLSMEQDNIDNANVQQAFTTTDEDKTLLDNLGIKLSVASNLPNDVLALLGSNVSRITNAYELSKPELDNRFLSFLNQAQNKDTSLRFHGTRWRNGMPILQTGLRILGSKSSTYSGSMLGDAIYTSKDFTKSLNYSDGLIFVLNVHTGKPLLVTEHNHVRSYSYDELQKLGFDSVNADPGLYTGRVILQRHEQTIYREEQQTFKYLLEL